VSRILIVPAAGAGTRLGSALPKLLVPVGGRPMIDHIVTRYEQLVETFLLVVNPAVGPAIRTHMSRRPGVELEFQSEPTGMLDAILTATDRVRALNADEIWITWCDQIAILPETASRLAEAVGTPKPDLALPTITRPEPYIHFERDEEGRIIRVLQRREGDIMPPNGEGDSGLFALSRRAYLDWLPEFARSAPLGERTGERNFLPFIPWVAARAHVRTFPLVHAMESVGINTPAELDQVEVFLRALG
jgi:bifunctional UDP-N-acetylglucosamine pyrophosphorylase/glucosamine-1-phosphate N-acetyltransferase